MSTDLAIQVEVLAGAHVEKVCRQMVMLANQLGVAVESSLNGIKTRARPGVDPDELYKAWEVEMTSTRAFKYAIV